MKTRCSKCRFHEIGLTGDYAPRCAGKVGLKMRHDALTLLVARAFQKAGFDVMMEQNGGQLDERRPADVEVKDWTSISNGKGNTSLAIDLTIIDPTADSHSGIFEWEGVGPAACNFEG